MLLTILFQTALLTVFGMALRSHGSGMGVLIDEQCSVCFFVAFVEAVHITVFLQEVPQHLVLEVKTHIFLPLLPEKCGEVGCRRKCIVVFVCGKEF